MAKFHVPLSPERRAANFERAQLIATTKEFNSKSILRGMRSQLECPGCTLLYEDPRVLACSHTYCRLCLEKLGEKAGLTPDGGHIDCPECGTQTDVPEGDVSLLQYNFFIQHIMDLMLYYSSPEPVPLVHCGTCRKNGVEDLPQAVARCSTCATFLCKACYELHSIDDFTKLHSTLSITERGDSGFFSCLIPDETGVKNCRTHNWKPFSHFCITCSKGICIHCTKSEHKMHLFARPEDLRPEYTAYVKELMSRTARLVRRTESAIRSAQDLMSGIQLLAATQIEELLRTHDVLLGALEGRQSMLLEETEKCRSEAATDSCRGDTVDENDCTG